MPTTQFPSAVSDESKFNHTGTNFATGRMGLGVWGAGKARKPMEIQNFMKTTSNASIINFGKYRGQTVEEAAKRDIAYLRWCLWNHERLDLNLMAQFKHAIKTITEQRFPGYGEGDEVPVLFPNGQNEGMPVRWCARNDLSYTLWFYRKIREHDSTLCRAIKSALDEVGVKV
jgi:hypothetical protein